MKAHLYSAGQQLIGAVAQLDAARDELRERLRAQTVRGLHLDFEEQKRDLEPLEEAITHAAKASVIVSELSIKLLSLRQELA